MKHCVFCKIANREFGNILCETEDVFIILDINPLSPGHLLVIPKYHAPRLCDLPDDILKNAAVYIKKVASTLGFEKYNVLQNNGHIQSVDHVHFHIVPYLEKEQEGLVVVWAVSEDGKALIPYNTKEYHKKLLPLNICHSKSKKCAADTRSDSSKY